MKAPDPHGAATTPDDVLRLAAGAGSLAELGDHSTRCRACPRLVAWREQVAQERRAAFADQVYWGRPVPGFGAGGPTAEATPASCRVLVVGLAPAAHGGNRTGRVFTGDRSGDVLFAALHRAGLATQPTSVAVGDGLRLHGVRLVAAVRCAPPANRPTPAERDTCAGWLDREVALVLPGLAVVLALGGFAWSAAIGVATRLGATVLRPRPVFGHGAETDLVWPAGPPAPPSGTVRLVGCYHPSQQNTFTGRLTPAMLDDVLRRLRRLAGLPD